MTIAVERALCTRCPLNESAITNCIAGRGPSGGVMLVAQGPGGQEDLSGEVLVGRSGQLLDAMLRDAGFDPDAVFKTNATRCRAPRDRAPMPKEIEACRDHLKAEIERVQPQVIVALGDTALRSLCLTSGVQAKRGKELLLHKDFGYECGVWPTYHPAFVLRSPMARNIVVADLRRVRDRTKAQDAIPWRWFDSQTAVEHGISRRAVYAVDIEAETFVDPKTKKKTYSPDPKQCAVASENGALVAREADQYNLLAPVAFMGEQIVTHNGWLYDIPKIREHLGVPIPWGRDTMVMAYLDDETQPLGLESLCVKYLGVRGWKEDKSDAALGSDQFAEYNARDAWHTLQLDTVLLERLGPRIRIADEIILPGKLALDECSQRGIFIDGQAVANAKADVDEIVARTRVRLREIVGESTFNPNSGKQIADYLQAQGISLPPTAGGASLSTSRGVLQELIEEGAVIPSDLQDGADAFLHTLLEYRKANKTRSTYIEPYEEAAASADGRVHNEYYLYKRDVEAGGTITGRVSSRNPNVQNLDRKYKHFFSAAPGNVWVEADYSAIEFRIAAWLAQESVILDNYARDPAWDPHRWFAARLYHTEEAKIEKLRRQVAKSANFSQLYVGGAETLVEYGMRLDPPVVLTYEQALFIHREWHKAFPGFAAFYQRTYDELKAQGYVESPTGRRRHFGEIGLLNRDGRSEALRQAVNFKAQSFATADISLLGLAACQRARLPITWFGHDAIRFEFAAQDLRENNLNSILETIRTAMLAEPVRILRETFGVDLGVPLDIEIKTSIDEE